MKKKVGSAAKILRYLCLLAFIAFGGMIFTDSPLSAYERVKLTWEPGITVSTLYGKVKGYESSPETLAWKAIPYAKPPVGELRWKSPQDPDPWTGIREATKFCEQCPQYALTPTGLPIAGNEDCLYLNIWRPKSQDMDLPVYVWLHDGGDSCFTACHDRYDGTKMATKCKMVVVTVNYRLGPMGWFTHPALRHGKDAKDDSGNYGTLDMIKALQFIRENIKAFGGDPGNITLAGSPSGSHHVLLLLSSPIASGLFHKAIVQSGSGSVKSVATGEAHVNAVLERLLVNDGMAADKAAAKTYLDKMSRADMEKYLRSKTAEELLKAHEMLFNPMIKFPSRFADGTVIHKDGIDPLNDPNKYNHVPIILGTNKEERKLFMAPSLYSKMDPDTYQKTAIQNNPAKKQYDHLATILSTHKTPPDVYRFQLDYGAYNPGGYNAWPTNLDGVNYALKYGASHTLEISFFWGNFYFYGLGKPLFREDNRKGREALSHAIMSYVAEFARTGRPGDAGGVLWEPWSNNEGEPKRLLFDADDTKAILRMSNE